MKILLIGPCPPPHGGISVHVAGIQRELAAAGIRYSVLDTSRVRNWMAFHAGLVRRAMGGWMLHIHTNGHNWKSWVIAFVCGLAGRLGTGSILTLHSGMVPEFLSESAWRRRFARVSCGMHSRIVCVSRPIQKAIAESGVNLTQLEIASAWLGDHSAARVVPPEMLQWADQHYPLLTTTLFFRPEYGFDLLLDAIAHLRRRYPAVGCIVMGSGENRSEAERDIRLRGLDRNILLVGDVSHDTCLSLISRSDAFLRLTLRDGDSMSVREALALGVPSVASRVGTRPLGTLLFNLGDLDQMFARIDEALTVKRIVLKPDRGCKDRLIGLYNEVAHGGEACLEPR
jgi:glycogen(starch) synthase